MLRSKGNQTMKFSKLIEYKRRIPDISRSKDNQTIKFTQLTLIWLGFLNVVQF